MHSNGQVQDITVESIIAIHDGILAADGGDCRVLSEAGLHNLAFRANLTNDPYERAASAFWMLCAFPAFREGNRRTACRLAEMILGTGGGHPDLPCSDVRALIRGIEGFTAEIDDVRRFLLRHAGENR